MKNLLIVVKHPNENASMDTIFIWEDVTNEAIYAPHVKTDWDDSVVKQMGVFQIINNDFPVVIMLDLEALKAPQVLQWTQYEMPYEAMGWYQAERLVMMVIYTTTMDEMISVNWKTMWKQKFYLVP